ncbi:MAG: hypothetical protein HY867_11735 [Chloroflexi bacterium]|nr:hypothetical protein [Chloroflexota bacterium]
MDNQTPPLISSFIVRFVLEGQASPSSALHGTIRHIQSAEELNFNEWREALEFMHRFVHLDELQPPSAPQTPIT